MSFIKYNVKKILSKIKLFFYPRKKNILKIEPTEKILVINVLLQDGYLFLYSAKKLFSNPFSMLAGAVLSHHGIELILKACWIWDKNEYSQTHKLLHIVNQISFLKADKEKQDLITKINTFYHFRYPMEEKVRKEIQKQLDRINDNEHGIPTQAGELATYEWDKVQQVYSFIINSMPENLHSIRQDIENKYSSLETLTNN
jgi:HEPN domain-containing protein